MIISVYTLQASPLYNNSFYQIVSLDAHFFSEECTKNVSLVLGLKGHKTIAGHTLDSSWFDWDDFLGRQSWLAIFDWNDLLGRQ